MGQLGSLVWKNFQFCRRHYVKTLLFYAIPLLFCCFLFMTLALITIDNKGDCDYQPLFLPPSSPLLMLSSLVCADPNKCLGEDNATSPRDMRDVLGSLGSAHSGSRLCPGQSMNASTKALRQRALSLCEDRPDDATYASLQPPDLIFRGLLYYTPQNAETDAIMTRLASYFDSIAETGRVAGGLSQWATGLSPFGSPDLSAVAGGLGEVALAARCYRNLTARTRHFPSVDEAREAAQRNDFATQGVWAILHFNETASHLRYKVYTHYELREAVSTLYLQAGLEAAFVEEKTSTRLGNTAAKLLPKPCHKDPAAYGPSFSSVQFVVGLGFIMLSYSLTSEMCFEKSSGLLEFLFIAGVPRWKVKLSWAIFGGVFFFSLALICGAIFKFVSAKLIEHTALLLVLLVMLLFACSLMAMCFLVASLMSTAQKAGILIFVSQLAAYFLPSWLNILPRVGYSGGTLGFVKLLSFLHSTVAAQVAFAYVFAWEEQGRGVDQTNLFDSPAEDDGFRGLGECLVYLLIQIPMYLLLSWYFDHTAPSKYGLKWPLWFPCLPSFWGCGGSGRDRVGSPDMDKAKSADVEVLDSPKAVGVHLLNLNKSYGKGKQAVDQLSVDFYADEVTALLGHNGAGKSTTMNMLTGMISPTSGRADVDGQSVYDQMGDIRRRLGFCPQYDIVYPELSVKDHMHFYGDLKGIPRAEVEAYYKDVLAEMKMLGALGTPAAALSGGMKRKLSMAVALLGSPKTIILDEPTSAIDPFSRRAIWDLILRFRGKATVLISTHYMQEADVLADRIAIIHQGSLKCAGSPAYLKERYGSGSNIVLAHRAAIDADDLQKKLAVFCPLALRSSNPTETVYQLDPAAARSPDLIPVFEYLETKKDAIGLASFGISESTMEQVFFKVAEGHDSGDSGDAGPAEKKALFDGIHYKHHSGPGLYAGQLLATWIKRAHLARKSLITFVFQVLAPLLFAVFLLLFNKTIASSDSLSNDVKLMHMWEFAPSQLVFYASETPGSSVSNALVDRGFGQRCMTGVTLKDSEGKELSCRGSSEAFPASVAQSGPGGECACGEECPADAIGDAPKEALILSNDTLVNLSGRNVTAFLLKHRRQKELFGGVEQRSIDRSTADDFFASFGADVAAASGKAGSPLWAQLDALLSGYADAETLVYAGLVDSSGRRPTEREVQQRNAQAQLLNGLNNARLRAALVGGDKAQWGISYSTEEVSLNDEVSRQAVIGGILMGFFGSLALLMPIFNVILVLVNEASSGNKRLQLVLGLHPLVYWSANFIWDVLLFTLSLGIMTGFMAAFPDDFDIKLWAFFLTGLVYGVGMILFSYVLSFVMKTARVTVLVVGLVAPFFSIAALILLNFSSDAWYETVNGALNLFPPYFITDSLALVSVHERQPDFIREPLFDWTNLGKRYTMAGIFAALCLVALICFQSGMFSAAWEKCATCCRVEDPRVAAAAAEAEEDPDVLSEEQRILGGRRPSRAGDARQDVLTVHRLRKVYGGSKVAVRDVSFGVFEGECFGLLGVNGAGKTTLFKMLAGFHSPTKGDARVKGRSIYGDSRGVASFMSYCPQEDVLFGQLTPAEHLHLYARIRGIPSPQRGEMVDALVESVGLRPHVGKQSQALSGGNKRKLNFAMAVLDWPECIFLDEMTTGMDPKARRAAWECLEVAIGRGCAVVITSHSMEECEALCNRLVIMVNGRFNCLGGVQYLKDRFGNSYSVKLRLAPGADPQALQDHFLQQFASSSPRVVEAHAGQVLVEVAAEGLELSRLFRALHAMKETHGLHAFSASQTTLEHVFVNMVKDQQ